MEIFFSVGEPSGDLHGANLIREIKRRQPAVRCVGYGGPRMAEAGCRLHFDLTQLAVMWVLRVVLNIHKFWNLYSQAKRYFREQPPEAVVLIDYPGFNWWIARAAKSCGIPVFYYGAPQMWAWAPWRVRKMRRLVDHVLCKLPFEARWYRERGCNATYVGHPFFDEMQRQTLDQAFLERLQADERPLIGILPGSRMQEVASHLPWFLKAAEAIARAEPNARFAVAAFNEKHAAMARQALAKRSLPIDVFVGRTPEVMRASRCCMACSGSVSLELLHHQKPTVILYFVSPLALWVSIRLFIKVKYITLVNLLADPSPFVARSERYQSSLASDDATMFPELLTSNDPTSRITAQILRWLQEPARYEQRVQQLAALRAEHGAAGASERAAEYLVRELSGDDQDDQQVVAPHFGLQKLQQRGKFRVESKNSP